MNGNAVAALLAAHFRRRSEVGTSFPIVATGLDVLTMTEGQTPNDWLGFSFVDPDGEGDITGIFEGGQNPTLIKDSGDARISVVDNRPVADDSGGGFEATATFSAIDEIGQTAGPVTITFTVTEALAVSVSEETGEIETVGDGLITVVYDGPTSLYDDTYQLDPTLVENGPPQLWAATAGPKISGGVGYPGLWFNDETTGGEMSLSASWLDESDQTVLSIGTVTPTTDWSAPAGATVLRITATDTNGSTVKRSDDAISSEGWVIVDNGDGTFSVTSAPSADAALNITDNGDGTFDVAA